MVQDYLPAIDTDGEIDVVFFAGELSHAVPKKPALQAGVGVVDRPWERMAWSGLTSPSAEQSVMAELTMAVISRRIGGPPAYARVDLINGNAAEPLVLEVELIDPYLSLDMNPAAAACLAETILRS
jgi:hypothetical protein